MASQVEICNRALQELGELAIASIDEGNKRARECKRAYEPVLRAELRKPIWNFSITRIVLAPDSDTPAFDYDYQFTFPTDCIVPIMGRNDTDWTIEGRKILTNASDTLNLRYVRYVTDVNEMDPLFREAFAMSLAARMAEVLTQSNTKKAQALETRQRVLNEAKLANALLKLPVDPVDNTWISVRD